MAELVFLRRGEEVMCYHLDGAKTTIGRGARNDIAFPEHEPYISRYHASVEKRAGGFWLRDLSGDGIQLNGTTLHEGLLRDGDRFHLGKWEVLLRIASEESDVQGMTRGGGTMPLLEKGEESQEEGILSFALEGQTMQRSIGHRPLTIGSSPENDICLRQPFISGFHCRIYRHQGRFFLRDLDSKNGSWINGLRTIEGELPNEAELYLGKFPMRFTKKKKEEKSDFPGRYGMISRDPSMEAIFEMIQRVADHDAPVLISGESGTGKELVARAIHDVSQRRNEPFRAVNCGAIAQNLLESEFFGHEKGAFTGALQTRIGAFEEAGRGTLFLDEIGDLPLEQQVAFLRVLEVGVYRRVGGIKDLQHQARVITATHRDLWHLVNEGLFREDLYHRIGVLYLRVPPLRERIQDISLLARFFIKRFAQHRALRLTEDAIHALQQHPWQGNVRELRNVMQRAIVMVNGTEIHAADLLLQPSSRDAQRNASRSAILPAVSPQAAYPASTASTQLTAPTSFYGASHEQGQPSAAFSGQREGGEYSGARSLDEAERLAIIQALDACRGVVSEAARRLGIGRSSIYSKMKRHGIEPQHYKTR